MSQKRRGPKRIAVYLPNMEGGGAERIALTLVQGFAARGCHVDLVLAAATGSLLAQAQSLAGVRVVDLGAGLVRTSVFAQLVYAPALARYLRSECPESLLSIMNHANVIALYAKRLAASGVRLVISEHNNLSATRQHGWRALGARRGPLMPWIMQLSYPAADAIVAVSQGVAEDLAQAIQLPRDRIKVIYNPATTPAINELAAVTPSHTWFAPGKPPVLLGVGRLVPAKNFEALIDAFARVRRDIDCRLMIIGEGALRERLESRIRSLGLSGDVTLPGFQVNPYMYMRHAAAFILSSNHEGLPTVLVEAMACGTPVISTDCPSGPAEILEEGRWGRLVPVGDVPALANAMLATLRDRQHPDVLRRARDFGIDQAVDRYLRLLDAPADEH